MLRFNAAENLNPGKIKYEITPEGFMRIESNILKADHEMIYRENGKIIKEYIPKKELFSEDTKKSFMYQTATLEHPKKFNKLTFVDSDNIKEFKKGTIVNVYENGDCLGATIQIEDKKTVELAEKRIKNGEQIQISAGYTAKDRMISSYKKEQINIRGNHVALLYGQNGRAGSDVRLIYNNIDEYLGGIKMEFNGKEFDTADDLLVEAKLVLAERNKAKTEVTSLTTEKNGITTKYNAVDKELKELKQKFNSLETEGKESEIRSKAAEFIEFDENMSTVDVMKSVIKEDNPKFNSDPYKEIDELRGLFNYSVECLENSPEYKEVPGTESKEKFNNKDKDGEKLDGNIFRSYGIKEGK